MSADGDKIELDESAQRAAWRRLTQGMSLGEAEPSPDFAERVRLAVDDTVEEAQRDEWKRLSRGVALREATPSADFTAQVLREVRRERRRLVWASFLSPRNLGRIAAAAAAVVLFAFVVPELAGGRAGPSETRVGPYADKPEASADALAEADAAADWLAARQQADGSWSPAVAGGNEAFRPALTALALMALERHAPLRHKAEIDKAVAALEAMQGADGSFGTDRSSRLYNHAFATFALLDHAAQSGGGMSRAASRAIDFAIASQNQLGAWGYSRDDGGNAALTVWELGILLKARKAGWDDGRGGLRRGLAWLRRQGAQGLLDYREAIDRQNSQASGGVMLTMLATDEIVAAAGDYPALGAVAGNVRASCDAAYGRFAVRNIAEADAATAILCGTFFNRREIYPTVLALLGVARK